MAKIKEGESRMDINELYHEKSVALEEARGIVALAEGETRDLSAEEQTTYDRCMETIDSLDKRIARAEALREADRKAAATGAPVVVPGAEGRTDENDETELRKAAFEKFIRTGANSLSAEEARALSVGTDSSGGYTVAPEQFVNDILMAADDQTFIRENATVTKISNAQSLGRAALDADPADSDWTSELAVGSEDSTMSFGKRELHPHPLAKLLKVSNTLLRLNPAIESLVSNRLGYKFAITFEKAGMTGTGSGQPLGLFTASSSGISTSRDVSTGNSTTAPTLDGLIEAKYSVKGNYWGSASWIFNRSVVKVIRKLKDGEGRYIWEESTKTGEPSMLLGNPVNMSEYAPNTMTTGLYVGLYGDLSMYHICDALDMNLIRLNELYAATNQTGFIGRLESDGMPVMEEAFARVKLA